MCNWPTNIVSLPSFASLGHTSRKNYLVPGTAAYKAGGSNELTGTRMKGGRSSNK